MASFNFIGLDKAQLTIAMQAEKMHQLAPKAVMAGAEAAIKALQATVPVRTGGLRDSLKAKGPSFSAALGHYAVVSPQGTNKKKQRYATIGYVLEYGRSNLRPRSWMRSGANAGHDAIVKAMEDALKG